MNIPKTDEMDHVTTEERRKLIGQCGKCAEWHPFDRDHPTNCPCGGELLSKTIRSQRTFTIDFGKKETAKLKRKLKQ